MHLEFIYYVVGTVSCTSNGRTHLIFTIRCNYYPILPMRELSHRAVKTYPIRQPINGRASI